MLLDWKLEANKWRNYDHLDERLKRQLNEIWIDSKLVEDSFYKHLEFGTGGMRGELGPGLNRINIYTVRRASEGLATYIVDKQRTMKQRGMVIAYDSRHLSTEFAREIAKTIGKYGVNVYLFESLCPTPVLSFAVRYLNLLCGVVITASHNPAEYNGLKVYGSDGGQISVDAAKEISRYINDIENELTIEVEEAQQLMERNQLLYIGEQINEAYFQQLKSIQLNENMAKDLNIVYTPLHGAGNEYVQRGLKEFGFQQVTVVKEQQQPDPNFSTVDTPNPEEPTAFTLAMDYGEQINADILLATDPDADRLGVAVKNLQGQYKVLTGNQIGVLLLEYLLSQKKEKDMLPTNGIVLKTIVTSEIGRAVANAYQLPTFDTLTGFKFIGEKINEYEQTDEYTFLFGYEESYGYLIGDFVRDKDAIQAAVLIAEVAAYYKEKQLTLYEGLLKLFDQYGYFQETIHSIMLKGKEGAKQIEILMETVRSMPIKEVNGIEVAFIEDYLDRKCINVVTGEETDLTLPTSNVLKYKLQDHSWFCFRPSGTEPKIKIYMGVVANSLAESSEKLATLQTTVLAILNEIQEIHELN